MNSPSDSQRVGELWFADGTIVIRAGSKLFRVSKSILEARSTVFKDMAAFPQPVDDGQGELVDGAPVISLSDDAEHVEAFLKAIFDSSFFLPSPAPATLDTMGGILLLSHKYDVKYLYLRALEHLEQFFFFESVESLRAQSYAPAFKDMYISKRCASHLTLICVATATGALWLLPLLYYFASHDPHSDLFAAMMNSNGTIPPHVFQQCLSVSLSPGQGLLKMSSFLKSDPPGCTAVVQCKETRAGQISGRLLGNLVSHDPTSPLHFWAPRFWDSLSRSIILCAECRTSAKTEHDAALQEYWDGLPGMFGLPPWQELRALRERTTKDLTGA
ncbi:hypothetical protein C8F01DRAFT_1238743 [Mycena amicta]|nr:hypothetical protein C8F01DRAFT_1238743 [Mycena amicta]